MKTWQMIKELTENPTKKFRTANIGCELESDVTASLGEIIIGGYPKLYVTDKWEEIKVPVSFMEAFKALRSDCKNIYCMNGKSRFDFMGERFGAHVFDEDLIGQGKWYIED